MPGAARYGQGRGAGSVGLYLASDAGRGKPVSSYESGLSLQLAEKGEDSQPRVKLGKTGTNGNTSSYCLPLSSHHIPPCRCTLSGKKERENGQQSGSREGHLGRSRWKCWAGPRQGPPEVQSWGGRVWGRKRLRTTASGRGGHRGSRGAEHFERYLEVPGLVGAPLRCREVPFAGWLNAHLPRGLPRESRAGGGVS